jgi:hypothetical protein
MSVYAFAVPSWTTGTGLADNVSLVTLQYMALLGGTATQMNFVEEVMIEGLATAAAPGIMVLARNSTVSVGATTLVTPNANGPTHPSAGVLTAVAVGSVTVATTFPVRSNSVTSPKKVFSFNFFGGIISKNYANTQDRFGILGNTASLGELSLSAFTGTTSSLVSSHILYETL